MATPDSSRSRSLSIRLVVVLVSLVSSAWGSGEPWSSSAVDAAGPDKTVAGSERPDQPGEPYEVFLYDPRVIPAVGIFEVHSSGEGGGPSGVTFRDVETSVGSRGRKVLFATNGGIFESPSEPTGLLVSGGRILAPLNTRSGQGNFYAKPNGVFFLEGKEARVLSTDQFRGRQGVPNLAIQSGPLLLENGKVLRRQSEVRIGRRSGVGIREDGAALFLFTESQVSLHDFALAFKDRGCGDALYLDGAISEFFVAGPGKEVPNTRSFATVLALTAPPDER